MDVLDSPAGTVGKPAILVSSPNGGLGYATLTTHDVITIWTWGGDDEQWGLHKAINLKALLPPNVFPPTQAVSLIASINARNTIFVGTNGPIFAIKADSLEAKVIRTHGGRRGLIPFTRFFFPLPVLPQNRGIKRTMEAMSSAAGDDSMKTPTDDKNSKEKSPKIRRRHGADRAMAATPPPPAAALEQLSSNKMFGGRNLRFRHQSATLGCPMTFSIYLPPSPASNLPVLYWLSGLNCTDENFIIKSGAQRAAAACGIALIAPDTSPRGLNIEGESDSYDFGVGAGFYLNSTNEKWKNWRMYDYVVKELPKVLSDNFEQLNTFLNS
ncbi:hypothetical protein BS78_03G399700 [Paspalum vaginatum]|nr:hypothetical protein BS78_03G399700 [Paspalum vaginatum]